ncbi:hypothetical protein, conserved [Leishmania tarentolae]|uniref:Uncharacterized protein n=1 Tax=Leishmania tarentolae TaxID=5689 RepID=A0A640KKF2_LEITA|nr:hypothetical protein, conserved [Leishmania tarentolae]
MRREYKYAKGIYIQFKPCKGKTIHKKTAASSTQRCTVAHDNSKPRLARALLVCSSLLSPGPGLLFAHTCHRVCQCPRSTLGVQLRLVLRQRGLDVYREVFLDFSILHEAACLLTKHRILPYVGTEASALLDVLGNREDKEGGQPNQHHTSVPLRGIAPAARHGIANRLLEFTVHANVEKVWGAELATDGRITGGVHDKTPHHRTSGHNVCLPPPLAVFLNLPVALCLKLAPAEHPLIQVLHGQFHLHLAE